MSTIEDKVGRRAQALGYAIGHQHVGNGRTVRTVMDPETGTVFVEAKDFWSLLPFLWRIPSIAGRHPRPTVEDLTRDVARQRGYHLLVRPTGGIALVDPVHPGRAVAVEPFWREAFAAVLKLPSIAPPPRVRPALPVEHHPAVLPSNARVLLRAAEREAELSRAALPDERREELEAPERDVCPQCRGLNPAGCAECNPVPPIVAGAN